MSGSSLINFELTSICFLYIRVCANECVYVFSIHTSIHIHMAFCLFLTLAEFISMLTSSKSYTSVVLQKGEFLIRKFMQAMPCFR